MANPGHRYDRSAARMRKLSGFPVYSVSLMIDLEGEHRPQNGMAQVVVALIPGQVSEQVLDGVIGVLLRGNLLVIPVKQRLPIFLRAVLGDLRSGEHGVRRQEVKRIRCSGLAAAILIDLSRNIRLDTQDHAHYSSLPSSSSSSKHIALQDSMWPLRRASRISGTETSRRSACRSPGRRCPPGRYRHMFAISAVGIGCFMFQWSGRTSKRWQRFRS